MATQRAAASRALGQTISRVEAVQSAGFIWLLPLTFASSVFAPTQSMPDWLHVFADHQPITLPVTAIPAISLGQPAGASGWQAVAWYVGILLVSVPLPSGSITRGRHSSSPVP